METIKPSSLRIGNYVTSKTWRGYHRVSGIRETISKYVITVKGFDHIIEDGVFCELSPIPITEYILLKCGFKISHEGTYWKNYELPNKFHISQSLTDQPIINVKAGDFVVTDLYIHMKSVHQLQNFVFAYCGIELTINL